MGWKKERKNIIEREREKREREKLYKEIYRKTKKEIKIGGGEVEGL